MEREDLYEAAVRAVLDLCDEAEDEANLDFGRMVDPTGWIKVPMVRTSDIRKAIKDALLMDEEEPA